MRKFCYGNNNIGAIYRLFCGKKAVKVEYFHERKKKKKELYKPTSSMMPTKWKEPMDFIPVSIFHKELKSKP